MEKKLVVSLSLAILCVALGTPCWAQQSATQATSTSSASTSTNPPYKDPSLSIEKRAADLVSRMTLEEKVSQIGHTSDAVPRLGIPEYNWWNEGLHGVARAGNATVFPQAIGMAATFDEPLMHQIADVISTEFRAKYVETLHPDGGADWYRGLTVWSPNINIFRDPRWGRGQETYGEDPYLTARMGIAFVTGLQGNDPKYMKTIATAKHFAVHSGPEATRHSVDVEASRHDMEDTYLPAFRALITEGKADSVMCAYNRINGQPACANDVLLKEHLRGDWGFPGYVVSDCGAVTDIPGGHKFSKTLEDGVTVAFQAGMDLVCGAPRTRTKAERDAMLNAVKQGIMPEATLNQSMQRLFTARIRLGMFDPPSMVPYSKITAADNDTEAHRQLALKAAREAIVLLKNKDSFLPLKKTPASIAVIGPDADSLDSLIGNYAGTPSKPVTILSGIRARFPKAKVTYIEGSGLIGPVMKAVPQDALYSDDSRKEHGLKGEYFSNLELKGSPVMTRTDATVDFAWGDTGINHDLPNNYSVRWTGVLVPPQSGEFVVGFRGQDGWRLWLDGNLVGEDWNVHHPATIETKTMQWEKDHAYAVKIEYYQTVRSAEARLMWSLPGGQTQEAVDAAAQSDLVVAVLGLSQRIEGEEMKVKADGFASGDRTKLDLPAPQQQLLEKVFAAGKPVVLVLINGSAVAVNWADGHLDAIVEAWYPGEEGGTAVAEALAGDFSPAGRLPVTFYKSVDQLPPFEDYSMAKRTYRYFDGEPLYPFGYGLSYTSFTYAKPRVNHAKIEAKDTVTASVDVTNTGAVVGDEVVQVYLTHQGVTGAPIRALRGFQRIHLDRGQTKTVSFQLHDRDLDVVDPSGKHQIAAGTVSVWLGGGQPATQSGAAKSAGAQTQFTITSAAILPD
jgi:beta-glucosidase